MEFPGLYGDLQTGFEPIKFLETQSVCVRHVIKHDTDHLSQLFRKSSIFRVVYVLALEILKIEENFYPLLFSDTLKHNFCFLVIAKL